MEGRVARCVGRGESCLRLLEGGSQVAAHLAEFFAGGGRFVSCDADREGGILAGLVEVDGELLGAIRRRTEVGQA